MLLLDFHPITNIHSDMFHPAVMFVEEYLSELLSGIAHDLFRDVIR